VAAVWELTAINSVYSSCFTYNHIHEANAWINPFRNFFWALCNFW